MEKVKFEVKVRQGKNGVMEKAIFINDQMLDWSVDLSSFMEAARMGPHFYKAMQKDIEKHFTDAVSETLGRKVTAEDIKIAQKTGWI